MSRTEPEAFGLERTQTPGLYRDIRDSSVWQEMELFDFGWGREPGYAKLPLPSTAELIPILFHAEGEDDFFGAAAILLEDRGEEALPHLEAALQNPETRPAAARRLKQAGLGRAANRSAIIGKSAEQVQADYERWRALAEQAAAYTEEKRRALHWESLFRKKPN